MRKLFIVFFGVLMLIVLAGCSSGRGRMLRSDVYLSEEELAGIFYDNREMINNIRNGLIASGFMPHDGVVDGIFSSSVQKEASIRFNHDTGEIFDWSSRPDYKSFESVQNIHGYAAEFLSQFDEGIDATISFWQMRGAGTLIEFDFRITGSRVFTGITYPIEPFNPEERALLSHIEGNWYFHWHMVP